MQKDNQVTFVEKAKNPENIAARFYPDFVKSVRSFQMFQEFNGNPLNSGYHGQHVINFLFCFFVLPGKEIKEICFVKNQFPRHAVKLTHW